MNHISRTARYTQMIGNRWMILGKAEEMEKIVTSRVFLFHYTFESLFRNDLQNDLEDGVYKESY